MKHMKQSTYSYILKYTGILLVVFSACEMILEIVTIFSQDFAAVTYGNWIGQLFMFQAGNTAVQLLFSAVGLLAGYLGISMSGNGGNANGAKYTGLALIVIYLIEGFMLAGANPSSVSWIRIVVLLVVTGLYSYAAWKK